MSFKIDLTYRIRLLDGHHWTPKKPLCEIQRGLRIEIIHGIELVFSLVFRKKDLL